MGYIISCKGHSIALQGHLHVGQNCLTRWDMSCAGCAGHLSCPTSHPCPALQQTPYVPSMAIVSQIVFRLCYDCVQSNPWPECGLSVASLA